MIRQNMIYSDGTADFRCPEEIDEKQTAELTLRVARDDADEVQLVYYREPEPVTFTMSKTSSDELFDYYSIRVAVLYSEFSYSFRIRQGEECVSYARGGVTEEPEKHAFRIAVGFHVPSWLKGAVMYQIFIDRFRKGDSGNDVLSSEYIYIGRPVTKISDWDTPPAVMDVRHFYGGDIVGILEKLDYLKHLGVEVIYLNPAFVSPSNHKYDCQDYDYIDPHLTVIPHDSIRTLPAGAQDNEEATRYRIRTADPRNLEASNRFFIEFVKKVHSLGMRLILDGVFNHCGSFHKWFDKEKIYEKFGKYPPGAYSSEESPYRDYFEFRDPEGWPDNESYDAWWGQPTLPKLNYEGSEELQREILRIAEKWVSPPFNCDGWRLDVAADLGHSAHFNHQFWRRFRRRVKRANPEAVIIAEHYGDPSSWLQGDQWDTIMNYDAFMEPVSWFLTGMEKHSDSANPDLFGNGRVFFDSMRYHMEKLPVPALLSAMNELSNHDHSRFMTRTSRKTGRLDSAGSKAASEGTHPGIFRQGVVMQMTWPGAPTFYYGDEAGVCGWTDPDSRRTYPWGHENLELIEFCRYMVEMRNLCPAFRSGSMVELQAENGFIAYGRFLRRKDGRGKSSGVVMVNTSSAPRTVSVDVRPAGISDYDLVVRAMLSTEEGYNAGQVEAEIKDGMLTVTLPPVSSAVFTAEERLIEEQSEEERLATKWPEKE